MKSKENIRAKIAICFLAIAIILGVSVMGSTDVYAQDIWVSAYYGGWAQGCGYVGNMQADKIDYSAVTHIIHFAIQPLPDGSIDFNTLCITPENSASLVKHAKAAGKKVLVSLGGEYTESAFLSATSDANRSKFINNLINFIVSRGYDGIDFDWEPISPSSVPQIKTFIIELGAALDAITPRPLLTAAVVWEPGLFAQLQDKFDQINIMTYDLAGEWLNATWFNAPVYDGGYWFPANGGPAPSANGLVDMFIDAGVEANKLGIGIAFYGYAWKGGSGTPTGGVTAPGQKWTTVPSKTVYTYYDIMDKFYQPAHYRYDAAAGSSYLSIDKTGSSEDMFITYNDEATCFEKIKYTRNKGIGGTIIFQLGGGWRPNAPVPDSLLQSVKDAVLSTQNQDVVPPVPTLNSPASGAVGIPTSTTLKWNSSAGANSYTLQVSNNSAFTEIVNHADITATAYNISGLNNNATYYWRVRAANTSGSSGWSNVWSFTTAPEGTVIVNFRGTSVSAGASLTWQTATENNNKGFNIERRLSTSATWSKIGFVAGAGTSYALKNYSFTDTKTKKRRTYIYRLKQLNTDGSFMYSSEVSVSK